MQKLHEHFSTQRTPQSQPIPGTDQVPNSAGGYAWAIDDWARLDRFLILSTEGGTYYVGEQKLTVQNAEAVLRCIKTDGPRAVARIVEISEGGRAPKNDPALFTLAMAAGEGDKATRKAALEALPRVARIGTHLFHFLEYSKAFRGWGKGLRTAVTHWYNDMPAKRLAYQVIKYRQRDGWTHRDALRLSHPVSRTVEHGQVFAWIIRGADVLDHYQVSRDDPLSLIVAFEKAQRTENEQEIISLVQDYALPWETLPTKWLKSPRVWEALLEKMPVTATIRNLGRMTNIGLLAPMSEAACTVAERLTNEDALRKARVHPVQVLAALITYQGGQGARGKLSWQPVQEIVDALDAAFYLSFGNVRPTGKRLSLALDVSGSMGWSSIASVPGLTPRIGSAAMALVTAAVERRYYVTAFTHKLVDVNVSPRQRLDDVVKRVSGLRFGRTNCALPMLEAAQRGLEVDAFVVYTDSETWVGDVHPVQALQAYRRKFGIPAKLIVCGMVSNGFTIADPDDGGMLDVVGFDTATPNLMSDFVTGGEVA